MVRKDTLKEALVKSGLWRHQYAPRIAYLKNALKGDKELLKKLKKMKTAELIQRIDRMQSQGVFGGN